MSHANAQVEGTLFSLSMQDLGLSLTANATEALNATCWRDVMCGVEGFNVGVAVLSALC